jgi:hypothetical protein
MLGKEMKKKVQVITLGTTCFARYIATKAGLKQSREQGELTMPFDLAVHDPELIPEIITTEFKWYLNDIRKNEEGIFELYYKKNFLCKSKRLAWLNHDMDLKGNAVSFNERYNRRVENFQAAIIIDTLTVFIQSCEYGYDTSKIINILTKKRRGKPSCFIFIDIGCNLKVKAGDNIFLVKTKYPFKDYIWHLDEHRNSCEGQEFENKIVEELNTIKKLIDN